MTQVTLAALVAACACNKSSSTPTQGPTPSGWWRDAVFYEVFVRSFQDSNGDGVGDLPGLVSRLGYLNDPDPASTTSLGVTALWLMPIFSAASYHGYDVTDYRSVDPAYGTSLDVEVLVSTAHARGMRVVLDMVLNHTSSSHPWFTDSCARGAKRGWYVWNATNPGWTQPGTSNPVWHTCGGAYYYGYFWDGMPDLNFRDDAVRAALLDAMRYWLSLGVDGFRLDAVRYYYETTNYGSATGTLTDLPETHAYLRDLRKALQADYPDVLLVAEAWAAPSVIASYWGAGDEAHLAFFFHTADALKNAAFYGNASYVSDVVRQNESLLSGKDPGFQAPFLSNHDLRRVMGALGGSGPAARVATASLLALPGTPFLYYGDEIGMQGGLTDPEKRTPLRWQPAGAGYYGFSSSSTTWFDAFGTTSEAAGVDVSTQQADAGSLWSLHRELVGLRRAHVALRRGTTSLPAVTGGGAGALAVLRTDPAEKVLFVVNYATTATGPFTVSVAGSPLVLDAEGLTTPVGASGGQVSIPGLAARSFAFVSLQ